MMTFNPSLKPVRLRWYFHISKPSRAMPSRNAPNVEKTLTCGLRLLYERPSVSSVAACSSMLISYEWVFGISATAFARRVDGFRSADTTNTWFGYFLATATYPASDPARGEIGFSA